MSLFWLTAKRRVVREVAASPSLHDLSRRHRSLRKSFYRSMKPDSSGCTEIPPHARAEFDQGQVDPQLPMERMILILKRSPEQEAALTAFMARQLNPKSRDFHHWLTPQEFGRFYGPSDYDIEAVTNWLQNHGFSIDKVANGRTFIEFSGTARLVQEAFHTEIHRYNVMGEEHIANTSDPGIPEALSPVVEGVLSLHNFFTNPMHRELGSFHRDAKTGKWEPESPDLLLKPMFGVNVSGSQFELVTPYDFATIYNALPLWNAGIDGTGQTIAIAGRSDIDLSDVATFRSAFGLPANIPTVIVNGPDPGEPSEGDRVENTVDVEWAGAVAKGATIKFVTTKSTMTTDGAVAWALYIIDNNVAPIMSFSYGECELGLGTAGNAAINSMWQEGAAAGLTEFVASGDQGAAACDGGQAAPYLPQYGLAVSGTASTAYDVAVGGTDFGGRISRDRTGVQPITRRTSPPRWDTSLKSRGTAPAPAMTCCCFSDSLGQVTMLHRPVTGSGSSTKVAFPCMPPCSTPKVVRGERAPVPLQAPTRSQAVRADMPNPPGKPVAAFPRMASGTFPMFRSLHPPAL